MQTRNWVKCIMKSSEQVSKGTILGIVGTPKQDLRHWIISMQGPKQTPYENGTFKIDVQIPMVYPFKPPKCRFITKVYHPNVKDDGQISLCILCDSCGYWSPAYMRFQKFLGFIRQLMEYPNPDDCLVPQIAKIYKEDREKYNYNAREWTKKYAM